ncbi:unnamed protein product [Urochloa humidicola]
MRRRLRDPTIAPQLMCGCKRTAVVQTAKTDRNYSRFLSCGTCHLFIWEDLLNKYAEEMVDYCHTPVVDELKAELIAAHQLLVQKDRLIASLEEELLKWDGVEQHRDHVTQQEEQADERDGCSGEQDAMPCRNRLYHWLKIILALICAAWFVKVLF